MKVQSQVDAEVRALLAELDHLFQQAQEVEQRYTVACEQLRRSLGDEQIKAYHGVRGEQRELEAQIKALAPVLRGVLAAAVFRRPSLKSLWPEFGRTVEGLLEPEPELGEALTGMRTVLLAVQAAGGQAVSQPPTAPKLNSDHAGAGNGQPQLVAPSKPGGNGAAIISRPGADGKEYFSVQEVARKWGLSDDKLRVVFAREPGVLVVGHEGGRGKRAYKTLRIPKDVLERVERRLARV
jgi:hypothetical protein